MKTIVKELGKRFSGIALVCAAALLLLFISAQAQEQKPTAVIGGTLSVQEGQTVYLDGALSRDSSGAYNIESFSWNLESSPEGSLATLGSSGQQVSFVGDVPGTYRVSLVVSDRTGDSDPAYATITVSPGRK